MKSEPKIHGCAFDDLKKNHKFAHKSQYCDYVYCKEMIHAFNNECMQPWVESEIGNYCLSCFIKMVDNGFFDV